MSWIQESHTIPLAYLQVIPDLKVRALHTKPARAFSAQHEAGPQSVSSSPHMPARPFVEQLSDTILSASSPPHMPARPLVEQLSDSLLSASNLHIYHPARAPPVQHESDHPSDLAPYAISHFPTQLAPVLARAASFLIKCTRTSVRPSNLLCLTSTSGPASIGSSLELRSCEADQKPARAFSAQHEAGPQPVSSSPHMPARPLVEQLSDTLLSASSPPHTPARLFVEQLSDSLLSASDLYARNKAPNRVCI